MPFLSRITSAQGLYQVWISPIDEDEVDGSGGVAPFSSTPWPRQRGQELRPVVSHYNGIISKLYLN